jgi:hypothetical protein
VGSNATVVEDSDRRIFFRLGWANPASAQSAAMSKMRNAAIVFVLIEAARISRMSLFERSELLEPETGAAPDRLFLTEFYASIRDNSIKDATKTARRMDLSAAP